MRFFRAIKELPVNKAHLITGAASFTAGVLTTHLFKEVSDRREPEGQSQFVSRYEVPERPLSYEVPEQPLSNEELNERMFKMLRERSIQAAEYQEKYGRRCSGVEALSILENRMTSDEANQRMHQMIIERARQDAEFESHSNPRP